MIEVRPAVSTDVETITYYNIALCRETEGREQWGQPLTELRAICGEDFISYPGSAWARTASEAPPPGSLSYHPTQARSIATDEANPGPQHYAA